jgi:flagellar hook-associated protein 2
MTMDPGVSLGTFTDAIAAQDAAGTVNGVAFTSSSNTVTSAISGVTLNLMGTTPSAPLTLTVDPARVDPDAIVTKVKTFVTAYNDVISTLTDKTTEKTVQNPTTDDDRIKGALFGDSTLTNLLNQLRQGMQNPITGLSSGKNIMNYAGLSTGPVGQAYTTDSASGKLVLDESKLRSSIAAGTADIKSLFMSNGATDGVKGLMQRVSDVAFNATRTNGSLAAAITGTTADSQDITNSINAMQLLLDQREQAMKTQFTAMETALSNLKAMQSSLSSYSSSS